MPVLRHACVINKHTWSESRIPPAPPRRLYPVRIPAHSRVSRRTGEGSMKAMSRYTVFTENIRTANCLFSAAHPFIGFVRPPPADIRTRVPRSHTGVLRR